MSRCFVVKSPTLHNQYTATCKCEHNSYIRSSHSERLVIKAMFRTLFLHLRKYLTQSWPHEGQGLILLSDTLSHVWVVLILSYLYLGATGVDRIWDISAGINAHGTVLLLERRQRFPLGQNTSFFTPSRKKSKFHYSVELKTVKMGSI